MVIAIVITAIVSLAVGGVVSYFISTKTLEKKLGNAKNIAEKSIKDAEEKASSIKRSWEVICMYISLSSVTSNPLK